MGRKRNSVLCFLSNFLLKYFVDNDNWNCFFYVTLLLDSKNYVWSSFSCSQDLARQHPFVTLWTVFQDCAQSKQQSWEILEQDHNYFCLSIWYFYLPKYCLFFCSTFDSLLKKGYGNSCLETIEGMFWFLSCRRNVRYQWLSAFL